MDPPGLDRQVIVEEMIRKYSRDLFINQVNIDLSFSFSCHLPYIGVQV